MISEVLISDVQYVAPSTEAFPPRMETIVNGGRNVFDKTRVEWFLGFKTFELVLPPGADEFADDEPLNLHLRKH